jgi:hypothetical protein
MGALGAGRSIYNNFIARGREVVFPKFTAMQIAVDSREGALGPAPAGNDATPK